MKIEILQSCASASTGYVLGQEYDVSDEIGKSLIKSKYAKALKTDKKKKINNA